MQRALSGPLSWVCSAEQWVPLWYLHIREQPWLPQVKGLALNDINSNGKSAYCFCLPPGLSLSSFLGLSLSLFYTSPHPSPTETLCTL